MKTRTTVVAILAAVLCGCRAPGTLSSVGESGGQSLSADELSAAEDASTRPAGMTRAGESENTADLPVSELLSRAEQELQAQQLASLPTAEAELALSQFRGQSAWGDPLPGSEPDGGVMTRQIRQEANAVAPGSFAADDPRRREDELRDASWNVADGSTVPHSRSGYDGTVTINPWSRQSAAINPAGAQTSPGAGPVSNATGRQTSGIAAADQLPVINASQNVNRQSHTGTSTAAAATTTPADDPHLDAANRRWPPATWAPLMETPGNSQEASAYETPLAQPPQYPRGGVTPVSGTVNPWNVDVRHANGPGGNAAVEQAHLEQDAVNGRPQDVIQPVSVQSANAPAAIPEWNARMSAGRAAATFPSTPGADSVRSGSPDPRSQRDLAGASANRPTIEMPTLTPGVAVESGQSARQSHNAVEASRRPTDPTHSPASERPSHSFEVPEYPYHSAATPGVSPESPRPAHTSVVDAEAAGWAQGPPNTSAATQATPTSPPDIVVPQPYRSRQASSGYERYPASNRDW